MPNKTGGKKYKSTKGDGPVPEMPEIDWVEGQSIGRVIKNLGDRNMQVYCNDGRERICHIRGGLKKGRCLIEVGDIVLISIRGTEMRVTDGDAKDRGDILNKFVREHHRELKKQKNVNPNLFKGVENMDVKQKINIDNGDDDLGGFVIEHSDSEDESEEDAPSNELVRLERTVAKAEAERKLQTARANKENARKQDDDDVDIDNI
jgi:translation initiation factor 1A